MLIFHKIIFKHIFHKREIVYMLPKGTFICRLKRKFCVASFWFLTIVILFVFVFFSFTPALKALVSARISFFFLLRVKSSFSPSSFWKERMPLSNSTVIFLPDVSDVWRRPNPIKTLIVHFLLQNQQWNQRMNSHEPCIYLKVKYSISWMEAVGMFMGICIDLLKKRKQY